MEINKIYHENCLDTINRMPDKFVDLTITSPPYNMRTRIRNGKYTTREKSEHFSKKYKYFDDALSIDDFYQLHSRILRGLIRVSKIVCYNIQIVTGSKEAFFKIIGDFAKHIKDIIIWDKGSGQPAMRANVLNSCYEMILILEDDKKCGRTITNAKFKRGGLGNIIRLNRERKISESHSATFPQELPFHLIKAFSNKSGLVYDPFMGSGTVAYCSAALDRNWIGSEIIENYAEMSKRRTSKIQKEMFV